jgi:hypothetical protein
MRLSQPSPPPCAPTRRPLVFRTPHADFSYPVFRSSVSYSSYHPYCRIPIIAPPSAATVQRRSTRCCLPLAALPLAALPLAALPLAALPLAALPLAALPLAALPLTPAPACSRAAWPQLNEARLAAVALRDLASVRWRRRRRAGGRRGAARGAKAAGSAPRRIPHGRREARADGKCSASHPQHGNRGTAMAFSPQFRAHSTDPRAAEHSPSASSAAARAVLVACNGRAVTP